MAKSFTEMEARVYAQLELIKANLHARHQSIVTISINGIALISIAGFFIKKGTVLTVIIVSLLVMVLLIVWFDLLEVRTAIKKSQRKLEDILGEPFISEMKELNNKNSWLAGNFPEIVAFIFSVIIVLMIYLVLTVSSA